MYLKRLLVVFAIFFIVQNTVLANEEIKAQNNAYRHNNLGLMYLKENYYFGAIKEFQIAIDLIPDKQASSTFYINLGRTYEKIGYLNLAQENFEKALNLNVLCFDNYLILAENYKKQGIANQKLQEFINKPPYPLNDIMIGLLYIQTGNVAVGMTVLDEFCNKEPNLIVTQGVRNYLDELAKSRM